MYWGLFLCDTITSLLVSMLVPLWLAKMISSMIIQALQETMWLEINCSTQLGGSKVLVKTKLEFFIYALIASNKMNT